MIYITRVEIKELSKRQLKGNWKTPVLLTFITTLLSIMPQFIMNNTESLVESTMLLIITCIISSVITIGLANFYLRFLERDGEAEFKDFIVSFNKILKSLGYVTIVVLLAMVLTVVCSVIIFASLAYFTSYVFGGLEMSIWGLVASFILPIIVIILALIIYNVFVYSIVLTPYITIENEDLGIFKAMKLSIKMMKGNKWKKFILDLSFIGWIILSLLTLGIGLLWLTPYTMLSSTNFYKDIISE